MKGLVSCVLAVTVVSGATAGRGAQENERYVYVTVLGENGTTLTGLTAEHFAVREGGQDRAVVRVETLSIPMHVAVLVDTSGQQDSPDESFRTAVADFVAAVSAGHHVALYAFGDRDVLVSGFTQDAARLRTLTVGMFSGRHERSHFIDAVDRALRDVQRLEARRPVIVAITTESPEASGRTAGGVIRRLVEQSVAFHVVSLATASGAESASTVNHDIPGSSRRLGSLAAAGEGDRERTQMVEQGTAVTGGGWQRITSTLALGQALDRIHRELSTSYLVTFARPGGGKVRDLQVGVMVDRVRVRATAAPHGTR